MNINFKFPKTDVLCYEESDKCKIVKSICLATAELIDLPENLTVEFVNMAKNQYADSSLDNTNTNLIRMSLSLTINDLMIPLVHELIHVNQMHEGKLMITEDGIFIWDMKTYELIIADLPYEEYLMLPWEADVRHRQPKLLQELLKSYK